MGAHRPRRCRPRWRVQSAPRLRAASQQSFPAGEAGSWDGGCIEKQWLQKEHKYLFGWGFGFAATERGWFGSCSSQGILKHRFYLQHSSAGFQGVKIQFGACLDAAKVQKGDGRAGNQPCALICEFYLSSA